MVSMLVQSTLLLWDSRTHRTACAICTASMWPHSSGEDWPCGCYTSFMSSLDTAPDTVALSFVGRINHGDVEGLEALMTEDHELRVFDEAPQRGRSVCVAGWRGYATAFPAYIIHPHRLAVKGNQVAILGHTTGSHLGLSDEDESKLTLIWIAGIEGDRVASWTLVEDTPAHRRAFNLDN
jgi:hypothetical protein